MLQPGGDGLKEAGFTVNEDGSVTAKDVGEWKLFFDPLEKTCVGEGAIYIFDPDTGAPECVMLPEEYGAAGEGLCEHSGSTAAESGIRRAHREDGLL